MNRLKKFKKSNKGYTLVEIFLSMMLASIFMILLMTILYSETAIITDMDTVESAKIYGDSLLKYMRDTLSDSMEIRLYPDTDSIETNGIDEGVFYLQGSKLVDGTNLVAGGMGFRYNVTYNVMLDNVTDTTGETKPVISIELHVFDKHGNLQYSAMTSFANITMMSRGKYFKDTDYYGDAELGGWMNNPRILYTIVTQENIFK